MPLRPMLLLLPVLVLLGPSRSDTQEEPRKWLAFNVSREHPFGRMNPKAPPELAQFDFMIGEFDAVDELRRPDGTWITSKGTWNANWFLNGFGIQDHYENEQFSTSNVRIYDPGTKRWHVTFYKMPGFSTGTWHGNKVGDTMVMEREQKTADGRTFTSRLTFFDITKNGYKWKSESVTPAGSRVSWKSTCTRRR